MVTVLSGVGAPGAEEREGCVEVFCNAHTQDEAVLDVSAKNDTNDEEDEDWLWCQERRMTKKGVERWTLHALHQLLLTAIYFCIYLHCIY